MKECHTVPYRPAGEMVEHHNATVQQCITGYRRSHCDWDKGLPEVAFAMQTTESVVTGYTPAFLCYGRELVALWDLWPSAYLCLYLTHMQPCLIFILRMIWNLQRNIILRPEPIKRSTMTRDAGQHTSRLEMCIP